MSDAGKAITFRLSINMAQAHGEAWEALQLEHESMPYPRQKPFRHIAWSENPNIADSRVSLPKGRAQMQCFERLNLLNCCEPKH
jgi:hypothetical protein